MFSSTLHSTLVGLIGLFLQKSGHCVSVTYLKMSKVVDSEQNYIFDLLYFFGACLLGSWCSFGRVGVFMKVSEPIPHSFNIVLFTCRVHFHIVKDEGTGQARSHPGPSSSETLTDRVYKQTYNLTFQIYSGTGLVSLHLTGPNGNGTEDDCVIQHELGLLSFFCSYPCTRYQHVLRSN